MNNSFLLRAQMETNLNPEGTYESVSASGCIILAKDTKRILLGQRGTHGDFPLTWASIGGCMEEGEGPKQACRREVMEETGYSDQMTLLPLMVFKDGDFTYYNHLAIVPWEFEAVRCEENNALTWFKFNDWPSPRHPGFQKLLENRFSMNHMLKHVYDLHHPEAI